MAALKKSPESGGDPRQRAERFTAAKAKNRKKAGGAGGWLDMGTSSIQPAPVGLAQR
jgi:hypothetical protein